MHSDFTGGSYDPLKDAFGNDVLTVVTDPLTKEKTLNSSLGFTTITNTLRLKGNISISGIGTNLVMGNMRNGDHQIVLGAGLKSQKLLANRGKEGLIKAKIPVIGEETLSLEVSGAEASPYVYVENGRQIGNIDFLLTGFSFRGDIVFEAGTVFKYTVFYDDIGGDVAFTTRKVLDVEVLANEIIDWYFDELPVGFVGDAFFPLMEHSMDGVTWTRTKVSALASDNLAPWSITHLRTYNEEYIASIKDMETRMYGVNVADSIRADLEVEYYEDLPTSGLAIGDCINVRKRSVTTFWRRSGLRRLVTNNPYNWEFVPQGVSKFDVATYDEDFPYLFTYNNLRTIVTDLFNENNSTIYLAGNLTGLILVPGKTYVLTGDVSHASAGIGISDDSGEPIIFDGRGYRIVTSGTSAFYFNRYINITIKDLYVHNTSGEVVRTAITYGRPYNITIDKCKFSTSNDYTMIIYSASLKIIDSVIKCTSASRNALYFSNQGTDEYLNFLTVKSSTIIASALSSSSNGAIRLVVTANMIQYEKIDITDCTIHCYGSTNAIYVSGYFANLIGGNIMNVSNCMQFNGNHFMSSNYVQEWSGLSSAGLFRKLTSSNKVYYVENEYEYLNANKQIPLISQTTNRTIVV